MKKNTPFLLMSFIMILMSLVTFAQQNYYVSDSQGNNSFDGLSVASPFKTIQRAADSTKPGDTVFIMPGTYNNEYSFGYGQKLLVITISGEPGKVITYLPYDVNNPPVLKMNLYGSGNNTTVGWAAIDIQGASYITIYHLKIVGANDALTLAKGEEVYNYHAAEKAKNNNFANTDWNYISTTNTNGIYIDRIKLPGYDNNKTEKENYYNFKNPHHITIDGCEISKFAGCGIGSAHADYVDIIWNTVHDNSWYTLWATSGISVAQGVHFDNYTGYKTIVRNNIVYGNKTLVKWEAINDYSDGNGIIADLNQEEANVGLSCIETYNGKTLFQNNICYNNGGSGLHSVTAANVHFIGNTAYKNGTRLENKYGAYANIFFCCKSINNRVINNIIYAGDGGACNTAVGNDNTNSYYANNIYFNGTHEALQSGNMEVDPKLAGPFNDVSNWIRESFKIDQNSPAYNTGITGDWGDYPDMWLTTRPQNGKYEIGAFEFPENITTSYDDLNTSNALQIYPNPNSGNNISISGLLTGKTILKITNMLGQIVYQNEFETKSNLSLSELNLQQGVYILHVQNNEQTSTKKFIVK